MIAQPKGYSRLAGAIRGLGLGITFAVATMLHGAPSTASFHPAPLARSAEMLPPCADPCSSATGPAPARYADRGYDDPIGREIERLDTPPPVEGCIEGPAPDVERRRVIPDSSGLCGIRCWYWRLRHGYCGPGCDYYRYWARERHAPPGLRHPRHACR